MRIEIAVNLRLNLRLNIHLFYHHFSSCHCPIRTVYASYLKVFQGTHEATGSNLIL